MFDQNQFFAPHIDNALKREFTDKIQCPFCLPQLPSMRLYWGTLHCTKCGTEFPSSNDCPSILFEKAKTEAATFAEYYDALRLEEGWASEDPEYYKSLPYKDLTGKHAYEWKLRTRHVRKLLRWLGKIAPSRKLEILEVGGGSGWLSRILAKQGHSVILLDLNSGRHALGAIGWSVKGVRTLQGDMERLPFLNQQFDIVLFNASLHYGKDATATLWDAWRLLRPNGHCVVMDSPVYRYIALMEDARLRTKDYFDKKNKPLLSGYYNPLLGKQVRAHPYFSFKTISKDFRWRDWVKKRIKEKLPKKTGAYFPLLTAQPIPEETSKKFIHGGEVVRINDLACVVIIRDQRVALMRRQVNFAKPYWEIPGGRVQPGERALDAAVKQVKNKIGLSVKIEKRLALYTFLGHRQIVYICREYSGELRLSGEAKKMNAPDNSFQPEWVHLKRLNETSIFPGEIEKDLIRFARDELVKTD